MKYASVSLFVVILILFSSNNVGAQCATETNISTVAGTHIEGYAGDGGAGTSAQIGNPYAVAADATGNFYIADYFNNVVRKVSATGIISTVAGTGTYGYNGDGILANTAWLNGPTGVTLDASGNLYIADKFNERIRRVDAVTGIITTIAGNGLHGGVDGNAFGNGGPATAACLTYPMSVALDCSGNMYIVDNGSQTVRKIDASGTITRFAGTHAGGYNGDGILAIDAEIYGPIGIAADCDGNVYIADTWNHRVRKVNSAGIISTFAGTGNGAYSGDGGPASSADVFGPWGITLDGCGNLYICDYDNNVVRKVSTSGIISTFAGTTSYGYTGDGDVATSAELYLPSSLAIDGIGNVYIADYGNMVIRLMGTTAYVARAFAGGTTQTIHVCKGVANFALDNLLQVADNHAGEETWTLAAQPSHGSLSVAVTNVLAKDGMVTPSGINYTPDADFIGRDEITVMMSDGETAAATTITVIIDTIPDAGSISGNDISGKDPILFTNTTAQAKGMWGSSDKNIATVDDQGYVSGVTNGVVTISYTITNNCGAKSAAKTIVSKVSDMATGYANIYPNPNNGTFRVNYLSDVDGILELVATDISGRVVYRGSISSTVGVNTHYVTLPATVLRPSILRLSIGDSSGKKYQVNTVMVGN